MHKVKFYYLFISLLFFSLLFFATPAQAVCPVCTVAVAAGVGLSRYLGVDDLITGLWIGGFIVSTIIWTVNYLNSKKIKFFGRKILITIVYYALIIIPLYTLNIMGHPKNKILGVDKLLISIFLGSVAFYFGVAWYNAIKASRQGKAHFHFQKIVMPIAPLIILSIAFYFLTRYL